MKSKFCQRIAGNSEIKDNCGSPDMAGWAREEEFRMKKPKFGLPRMKNGANGNILCGCSGM